MRKNHLTGLPLFFVVGQFPDLVETPQSWEDTKKGHDLLEHHHVMHRVDHDFGGDEEAYFAHIRKFGDRGSP